MAWELFTIEKYEVFSVSQNTPGLPGVYGFIRLHWQGKHRATLWFYRDSVATIGTNGSFSSGAIRIITGGLGKRNSATASIY